VTSTWTEADFDSLGWHDVHVHGFRVLDGEHGAGELWLDIDYILDWVCPSDLGSGYRFRIAPAVLKFRDVTSLQLSLDYATPTAAMGPFSLAGIEREAISFGNGYGSFRWTIEINWPSGEITFESPGFTQSLTGTITETDSQHLDRSERNGDSPVA
jgi:hypothetical protein